MSTVIVLKPENAESGAVAVMPVKAPTRLALPFCSTGGEEVQMCS